MHCNRCWPFLYVVLIGTCVSLAACSKVQKVGVFWFLHVGWCISVVSWMLYVDCFVVAVAAVAVAVALALALAVAVAVGVVGGVGGVVVGTGNHANSNKRLCLEFLGAGIGCPWFSRAFGNQFLVRNLFWVLCLFGCPVFTSCWFWQPRRLIESFKTAFGCCWFSSGGPFWPLGCVASGLPIFF